MESGSFSHFLISRFNIKVAGLPEVSTQWSEHRWGLFERYCLPSVENQSTKNFCWLLYINPNTPKVILGKLTHTAKRCEFLKLVPVSDDAEMKAHFIDKVRQQSSGKKFVITSRLDSDDAIGLNYIEQLQATCKAESRRMVLNFDNGLILKPAGGRALVFRTSQKANPFISLVEKVSPKAQTILHQPHLKWAADPDYKNLETNEPSWLQIVHEKNVINTVKGDPWKYSNFKSQFGIEQPIFQDNHSFFAKLEKTKVILKKFNPNT